MAVAQLKDWFLRLFLAVNCGHAVAAGNSHEFNELLTGTLQPRGRIVVLVHQGGSDVIARASFANALVDQDGPERRYGIEVLALENQTAQQQSFSIAVAERFNGAAGEHRVSVLDDPSDAEFSAAKALSRGSQLWLSGQDRSAALNHYQTAAAAPGDVGKMAAMLHAQGLWMLSRFQEAIDDLEALIAAENDPYHQLHLRWTLAESYSGDRRHEEALAQYELINAALPNYKTTLEHILTREEIRGDYGAEMVYLAFQLGDRSLMPAGRDAIVAALAAVQPYNDPVLTSELTLDLGTIYAMGGDWDTGLATMWIAADIAEAAGSRRTQSKIESNIGFILLRLGELGGSLQHYRRALTLETDGLLEDGLASVYAQLGKIYLRLGDYYRAEHYYEEAVTILRRLDLGELRRVNEIEYGNVLRIRGKTDAALQTHTVVFKEIDGESWNYGWLKILTALILDHLDAGNQSEAARYHAMLTERRDDRLGADQPLSMVPIMELEVAEAVARYSQETGSTVAAIETIEDALGRLEPDFERPRRLDLLYQLSKAYESIGEREQALAYSTRAMSEVSSVRDHLDVARTAPLWNARISNLTNHHVQLLIRSHLDQQAPEVLDEAFLTLQQSRANSLRASRVLAKRVEQRRAILDEQALAFKRMLTDRRNWLAADASSAGYLDVKNRALVSEEAYEQLTRPYASETPVSKNLETIAELQAVLGDDEHALIMVPGTSATFALLVSNSETQVIELPRQGKLRKRVESIRKAIVDGERDIDGFEFASLMQLADGGSLFIEDGGEYANLPWGVLNLPDGQLAAEAVSAITVPSLSEFFSGVDEAPAAADTLDIAIIADPAFAESVNGYGEELKRLPYSAIEAGRIVELFAGPTQLYAGENATIERLMSPESRNSRILHLASHGLGSADNPADIGFLMTDSEDGGLLTVEHVMQQKFSNDLIVISGCSTATGPILANEGMMGLSRAFLAQGGGAVLATLWPVSDRATAMFMGKFYELYVQERLPLNEAVRRSQLFLRGNPRYRAPYFWAAYSLAVTSRSSLAANATDETTVVQLSTNQ
ncbi:MAG: CHAT domain-containing tetratricopeptide repeat protein [Pseudomonadota bacterium]